MSAAAAALALSLGAMPAGSASHTFDLGLDLVDPKGRHSIVVIQGFHGWAACAAGAVEAGAKWGQDGNEVTAKCFDKGPPPCRKVQSTSPKAASRGPRITPKV